MKVRVHRRKALSLAVLAAVGISLAGTTIAVAGARATAPAWIVLTAHPNGAPEALQLFRVRTTGGNVEQITRGSRPAVSPAFSPNGKRIVFSRLGTGLFSMNVDGSGLKKLTSNGRDAYPAWSPDGKRIAFVRPYRTQWRVYTVAATGGRQRLLPKAPPSGRPSWTADSKAILIPSGGDLVKVDAVTGQPRTYYGLTLDVQVSQTAAVSPDGRGIVYIGPRISTGPEDCGEGACPQYALYRANVSAPHRARRMVNDTGAAGWSPDGTRVVFLAKGLLRIATSGTFKTVAEIDTAPHTTVGDAPPAWQPR